MKIRIVHIDPKEIQELTIGSIIGGERAKKLFDYPTKSFGTGTGAHVHIDFTRRLLYAGAYYRQFVDPETLMPGSLFNYSLSYKNAAQSNLPGYPAYFYRY